MEFPFDVEKVLPGRITILETKNESGIKIYHLDSKIGEQDPNTSWIYHLSANAPWDIKLKKKKEDLAFIIDQMGHASAQAQSLRAPITTLKKLLNSNQQKMYIIRDIQNNKCVIGFLKIGEKRLFVCDDVGAHHELDPMCILDFYVHETKQRCGIGHELFNIMLQNENVAPDKLAVDRPSFKFLSFLSKHYSLNNPITQSNNFVIYPGFFHNREVTRPPIFLYNGRAMQPVPCTTSRKQHSYSGSYANEAEALSSIKVSLCSSELKKNKTYYSSAARCLMWNDEEDVTICSKKYHTPSPSSCLRKPNNSSSIRSDCNLNIRNAAQSCSSAHQKIEGWNTSHSSPCSLTPVDNVSRYSRRSWDQTQSSWNIFGVKPMDYTLYQKQS